MKFTKMHGLGNDYLYVYGEVPADIRELSIRLSDRHFGAGSDGMIYICPSASADFKMRIFNADGSEAMMCGNGIRCVGKYVFDKGYTDQTHLTIETLSGIKTLDLHVKNGKVKTVTVDMGKAKTGKPLAVGFYGAPLSEACLDYLIQNGDGNMQLPCIPVDVGNPHAVFFTDDTSAVPLHTIGPMIEHHPLFPGGVNAEFVTPVSRRELRMRVWERGSGITMACGTGACASVRAAVEKDLCDYDTPVKVVLDGGILEIQIARDGSVQMSGPAEMIYDAECED